MATTQHIFRNKQSETAFRKQAEKLIDKFGYFLQPDLSYLGGGKLRTFGGPFFVMVQSSIFRSKVLFANFDQKIFAPRKFGFSLKSSIDELSHF